MIFTPRAIDNRFTKGPEVPTLPEFVYGKIREKIFSGEFEQGMPLRQEKIAKILGVSRLPVREALTRLEVEGIVTLRPRQGFIVAQLRIEDIGEIFDLRAVLEEQAAFIATTMRTEQDVADIRAIVEEMEKIRPGSNRDLVDFSTLNRTFHERLFAISKREMTCNLLNTLQNSAERYVRMGARLVSDLTEAHKEHRAIFEAFAQGDAKKAGRASRAHVQNTEGRLVNVLRKERGHS